ASPPTSSRLVTSSRRLRFPSAMSWRSPTICASGRATTRRIRNARTANSSTSPMTSRMARRRQAALIDRSTGSADSPRVTEPMTWPPDLTSRVASVRPRRSWVLPLAITSFPDLSLISISRTAGSLPNARTMASSIPYWKMNSAVALSRASSSARRPASCSRWPSISCSCERAARYAEPAENSSSVTPAQRPNRKVRLPLERPRAPGTRRRSIGLCRVMSRLSGDEHSVPGEDRLALRPQREIQEPLDGTLGSPGGHDSELLDPPVLAASHRIDRRRQALDRQRLEASLDLEQDCQVGEPDRRRPAHERVAHPVDRRHDDGVGTFLEV